MKHKSRYPLRSLEPEDSLELDNPAKTVENRASESCGMSFNAGLRTKPRIRPWQSRPPPPSGVIRNGDEAKYLELVALFEDRRHVSGFVELPLKDRGDLRIEAERAPASIRIAGRNRRGPVASALALASNWSVVEAARYRQAEC